MTAIERANQIAVERMMAARPILRRVARAADVIPGLRGRMLLHAGPPIAWERVSGPLRGAMIGACLYEGWAANAPAAEEVLRAGDVTWEPCHHHGAVGPMAGVTSPSMQVYVVENVTHGNITYSTLNEGYGKVLRYGAYSEEVLAKLRWMNEVMGPVVAAALELSGEGIDIRALLAESLHMGDEGHNRNKAGSLVYTARLAPWVARVAGDKETAASVLKFLGDNALSILNPVMAACKAMADAAHGVEGSTLMTAMARNGTDLGIRVSGLGDRWFTGPAGVPDGLYFPGFTVADANRDIGDSTITETAGIGAFAMAAAPAIVTFISGTPQDAINATLEMYEITVAEHTTFSIPALGFRGTPTGVDIRKVVELGITPRINTGIAHREAGVGQVGAGLVRPPLSVFEDALVAYASSIWIDNGVWGLNHAEKDDVVLLMTFLNRLREHCDRQPDKIAVEFIDDHFAAGMIVTYGALEQIVLRTMAMLAAKGVRRGDRVAMQLPKCLPFIHLHLAVMRLGAISLPLNPGYPARELAYFLADAEAMLLFTDAATHEAITPLLAALPRLQACHLLDCRNGRAFEALLEGHSASAAAQLPAPQDPDETCLMIYTSGTTGRPKGAELTYGNLTANLDSLHVAWGWQTDDILLHVLPIYHVHGLVVALHGALHAGATTIMHSKFDPVQTLETLERRRCTVFMAVPTIHRRLVDAPNARRVDLSHLRLLTSGSDRLPDDLFVQFREIFGHTLLERYGMSETIMLTSNPLHGERRVGSVGTPLPGVELRIVEPESGTPVGDDTVGEVQVRGANVCKGYWRQPDKSAAAFAGDGWFRTGDLGQRGPDGYLTLKGRSKDLIISGGFNVYPPEVELVIAEHPAVFANAVIGCPDTEWGERVTAIVVLHAGAVVTEQEIIAYCRAQLVHYKTPRQVLFVKDLPRNAMGKVQKAQLRQELCA